MATLRVRAYLSGLGYLSLSLQLGPSLPPLQYPLILLRVDIQRLLLQKLRAWQWYALELSNPCLYTEQLTYNSCPPPSALSLATICARNIKSLHVHRNRTTDALLQALCAQQSMCWNSRIPLCTKSNSFPPPGTLCLVTVCAGTFKYFLFGLY